MTDAPERSGHADGEDPRIRLVLALVFLLVVVGGVVDLVLDRPDHLLSGHVLFEAALIVVSLTAATYLARGWYETLRRARDLEEMVGRTRTERDEWKRRAGRVLSGLGQAIGDQFERWSLTPAERETALMILKGHSHKRIARLTARSERTVRQHAVAVYRKSGLRGRAELAAFFLDDLFLPDGGGPHPGDEPERGG